jgi:Ca2+-binding RTX toxin-like protein
VNGGAGDDLVLEDLSWSYSKIDGGDGIDTLSYNGFTYDVHPSLWFNQQRGIVADLSQGVVYKHHGYYDGVFDTIKNVENLIGTNLDDDITGDAGANRLDGLDGNDTFRGGAGNDTINGGGGTDYVVYSGKRSDYTVVRKADGSFTITDNRASGDGSDSVSGVERFRFADGMLGVNTVVAGTAFNQTLDGDGAANTLKGAGGNDLIRGWGGDDRLEGGVNDDTIEGGDGNDTLIGGVSGSGEWHQIDGGTDLLQGGAGDDLILADLTWSHNRFEGGAGTDTVSYRAFTYDVHPSADYYADPRRGIVADLGSGRVEKHPGLYDGIFDTLTGIENLTGTTLNDRITGDANANRLDGAEGSDVINGGAGNDTILGGAGDDAIDGGAGDDAIEFGTGNDTVYGGDGNDTIDDYAGYAVDVGDNVVHAGAGNDTVWTGGGNDTIHGGDGNDVLSGDNGDDSLSGDAGDDTLYSGAGRDLIKGGDGNDTVWAGSANDTINGGAGNDWLYGEDDDDTISGDAGNDVIDGGNGSDTAIFTGKLAEYGLIQNTDGSFKIIDTRANGDGTDTVYNVEKFQFADGVVTDLKAFLATSNHAPTDINLSVSKVQENSANDTVIGKLSLTDPDAGDIGTFKLLDDAGGRFKIDNLGNLAVKNGDLLDYETTTSFNITVEGTDRGGASIKKTFTIDIVDVKGESIGGTGSADVLTGTKEADFIYGFGGDDTIYGGDGEDFLYGNAGNDHLYGGKGNDSIGGHDGTDYFYSDEGNEFFYGGTGRDVFVFASVLMTGQNNRDLISDFYNVEDILAFDRGTFSSVADVRAHMQDTAEGIVISMSNGNSVLLRHYHGSISDWSIAVFDA